MSQAARPEIGIVGGRILSPSRRVLHAGYLLCLDRDPPVVDAHRGLPAAAPGHFGRANLAQNLTAVSAHCLATRREVFDVLGGFDERSYPGGLFDIDLCLRARARGLRVLFTPHAAVVRPRDDDAFLAPHSGPPRTGKPCAGPGASDCRATPTCTRPWIGGSATSAQFWTQKYRLPIPSARPKSSVTDHAIVWIPFARAVVSSTK